MEGETGSVSLRRTSTTWLVGAGIRPVLSEKKSNEEIGGEGSKSGRM